MTRDQWAAAALPACVEAVARDVGIIAPGTISSNGTETEPGPIVGNIRMAAMAAYAVADAMIANSQGEKKQCKLR